MYVCIAIQSTNAVDFTFKKIKLLLLLDCYLPLTDPIGCSTTNLIGCFNQFIGNLASFSVDWLSEPKDWLDTYLPIYLLLGVRSLANARVELDSFKSGK